MRGLFYKEARSLWQYGRSYILMVVIFFALSMANGTRSASGVMWLLYPVFLLASLPASLLNADEKDGWMMYCDTLPVTRRQIVTVKYIACAVLAAAVTLLAMAAAVLRGQTDPLYREQAMSTLDHIQEVTSVSSENVGMVILEFTEGVNMDTVGVDIQQEISQLSADWSDTVGTPYVLKINPSMLPVEVAAVSMEGMDTVELTEFLDETLMNKLEGVPGVARITTSGEIEQELHVVLDQKLIDKLNDRIAAAINGELDDAAAELNEKKEELLDADVEALIEERQAARKAKNFARADEIRQQLLDMGIVLEDTREGVKWKRA